MFFFSAEPSPVEPIQEEEYELPEQSTPAPPPPRPTKSQPQPPMPDTPPNLPPPRPSKAQPATPPAQQQDDLYEIADSPEVTSSELPQPPAPLREEENYEIPGESPPPSPVPTRPPKIPQPPIPRPSDVSQNETRKLYYCEIVKLHLPGLYKKYPRSIAQDKIFDLFYVP